MVYFTSFFIYHYMKGILQFFLPITPCARNLNVRLGMVEESGYGIAKVGNYWARSLNETGKDYGSNRKTPRTSPSF